MNLGDITGKVTANIKDFEAKMDQVVKTTGETTATSSKTVSGIGTAFSKVGIIALSTATAIATGFIAVSSAGLSVAGQLESARQGFVALLGSAEKADDVMARIKREAKATPFEMTGLVAGTQALTAITKDGNKAIDVLLDVGKAIATSGKGQAELDRVILNLQQISSTGKVTEMDIRQFQSAIPMFNDILKYSGLTTDQLKEATNSSELLFNAFAKAGAEGGITAQGFAAQAGTWQQLLSNLKDSWNIFVSDFVKQTGIFDTAKVIVGVLTDFISTKLLPAIIAIRDWVREAWKTIKEYWDLYGQPVFDYIVEVINTVLVPAWNFLKDQIKKAMEESVIKMEDVVKVLKIIAIVIGGAVVGAILGFVSVLTVLIYIIGAVITAITAVYKAAKEKFQQIKDDIQWQVDKIKDIFSAKNFGDGLVKLVTLPFETIAKKAKDIFENVKKTIQNALDLTKRNSPSVIDKLQMGVKLAEKELNKIGDIQLAPISQVIQQGVSGNPMGNINLSIDMSGANISSPEIAQDYATKIGDAIIGNLRTNRRSYV